MTITKCPPGVAQGAEGESGFRRPTHTWRVSLDFYDRQIDLGTLATRKPAKKVAVGKRIGS